MANAKESCRYLPSTGGWLALARPDATRANVGGVRPTRRGIARPARSANARRLG